MPEKPLYADDDTFPADEDDYPPRKRSATPKTRKEPNYAVKLIFGILLLLAGLAVAGWILWVLYVLIMDQGAVDLLQQFNFKEQAEALVADAADTTVALPEEAFLVVGYVILMILLGMAIKIARLLIENGTSLMHSDLRVVARQLREELANLED